MSPTIHFLALALAATATALPQFDAQMKGTTDNPCEPCNPSGATGIQPPAIGSNDMATLYTNALASVKGINFQSRSVSPRADSGFCCPKSLNCINIQSLNVASCYDKFTTNFGFADGSYGNLATGEYISGSNKANLLTGDYTSNGSSGNIYSGDKASDKPNTATLSKPPQFTGTGVGGAIPGNQLGSVIVYTTTLSGQTYTAPTTVPQSVMVNTVNGQVVSTTILAKTISAATTIQPVTSVATITQAAASQPASSKAAAAANVAVDGTRGLGLSVLGTFLWLLM